MNNARIEVVDGNPLFVIDIDGMRYSFTVRDFPEQRREWLVGVLGRQMQEIHDRAVMVTRNELQKSFRDLLGIK